MAVCGRSGVRALVAAAALLLTTLLGAQCASAQVAGDLVRPATAPVSAAATPPEHPGSTEDDSKQRHGPRRHAGLRTPGRLPVRVCECDDRTRSGRCYANSITVRDGGRRGRAVALPLLHQTFRC